jgi:uncharacterized SAM-binding protein YcdF (DUF218 family)
MASLASRSTEDEVAKAHFGAINKILNDEDGQPKGDPVKLIINEYHKFPRRSAARLMMLRAEEKGVNPADISEEEGAVDTISNFLYTIDVLNRLQEDNGRKIINVIVVAGSDHLPRTTWIADHLLPDDIKITSVESDPALSAEDYAKSCARELASFLKGSGWIGDTRNLNSISQKVEQGYFGANRKDTTKLAVEIAARGIKKAA